MGRILQKLGHFLLVGGEFSWLIWIGVTLSLIALAMVLTTIAHRLVDPIAVQLQIHRSRVAAWVPLSIIGWSLLGGMLLISLIGAPLVIVVILVAAGAGYVGIVALALVVGTRIMVAVRGVEPPPWQAAIVGMLVLRLVRVIPFVGAFAFGVITLIGMAAASALLWDKALSWHRRRLPDDVQFAGETLIEWDDVRELRHSDHPAGIHPANTVNPPGAGTDPTDPRFQWRPRD